MKPCVINACLSVTLINRYGRFMSTHLLNPFSSLLLIPFRFLTFSKGSFFSFFASPNDPCSLYLFTSLYNMDSTNPFPETSNFVDLLTSQQGSVHLQSFRYESFPHGGEGSSQVSVFSTQCTDTPSLGEDTPAE